MMRRIILIVCSVVSLLFLLGGTLFFLKIGPFQETTVAEFYVKGITCQSCSDRITSTLLNVNGVKVCLIDTKSGKASIKYAEGAVNRTEILNVVTDLGFKVKPISRLKLESYNIQFK